MHLHTSLHGRILHHHHHRYCRCRPSYHRIGEGIAQRPGFSCPVPRGCSRTALRCGRKPCGCRPDCMATIGALPSPHPREPASWLIEFYGSTPRTQKVSTRGRSFKPRASQFRGRGECSPQASWKPAPPGGWGEALKKS